jgi:hypothetical protein
MHETKVPISHRRRIASNSAVLPGVRRDDSRDPGEDWIRLFCSYENGTSAESSNSGNNEPGGRNHLPLFPLSPSNPWVYGKHDV